MEQTIALGGTRVGDPDLPPGTVRLISENAATGSSEFNLSPTPSRDSNQPLNWSRLRKGVNYLLVLSVSIMVFTAISMQPIFWQQLVVDLNVTYAQLNNSQSIISTGLTVGCIFFIPLAIKYGRRPTYILSTAIIFAVSIWTSRITTVWELYVTNLIMGLAGATNEAIVAITVADLFFVHQRATMNAVYMMMAVSGTFLTPMLAGVQATRQSWRWCYYVLSIFAGIIMVLFIFIYEETKYIPFAEAEIVTLDTPGVLEHPVKDPSAKEALEIIPTISQSEPVNATIPDHTWKQRLSMYRRTDESLWILTYRPFIALWRFPDVAFASLQYGVGLCWLVNLIYILNIVYPYEPYNFTPEQIGYMCLGPFVGFLIGSVYGGYLTDRAIIWFSRRNNGYYEPEMRLYLLHLPSLATSAGLITFGICTAKGMHWIYPSIGGAIYGFGACSFGDAVLTYVIDSHKLITGEAFVAITFCRNLFSIIMAQVLLPWLTGMGLQNMYVLQGCLALVVCLTYLPMIHYGKRARRATMKKYYEMALNRY